jgi:thioredoxin reductase (NADPH)
VDFKSTPKKIFVGNETILAETVIISTGASTKWLGIESERRLLGKGVSSCATCDGAFFKGARLVVVGGGDSAMEEANFLTRFASHVTVVHRRDSLRASKIMQERALKNPKINFIWNVGVEEILGQDAVTGVALRDLKTNELKNVDCEGVFVAIGHEPNTAFLKGHIALDDKGYVVLAERPTTRTNVKGVFAAGDVADTIYRQAITAAASGCQASIDAERYLEALGH